MIIILTEKHDFSSNHVIEWLNYYGKKWLRISEEDNVKFEFINAKPFIVHKDKKYCVYDIESVWFRRIPLVFSFENIKVEYSDIDKILKEEFHWYSQFLIYLISKSNIIGNQYSLTINKLVVNEVVKSFKIKTPNYIVTNSKKELEVSKVYITKTVAGNGFINFNETFFGNSYTQIVDVENLPDNFALSYFQEFIEKRYELRIFFLKEMYFSMAIFSQSDEQTKIDFRIYNNQRPNRFVPFVLPLNIKQKLIKIMKKLGLNTGSIDMIVSKQGEYYFLEVNPIGQFGMVSVPCNYNLEKLIAENL